MESRFGILIRFDVLKRPELVAVQQNTWEKDGVGCGVGFEGACGRCGGVMDRAAAWVAAEAAAW
jgi:hypothetical protein